jgi:hydrogenase maturation protease
VTLFTEPPYYAAANQNSGLKAAQDKVKAVAASGQLGIFANLDALLVIDSVDNGKVPGTITRYRREDLACHQPCVRMDTHSPAITESLTAAEVFFGASPAEILLVGISAETYAAGCTLSDPVKAAVEPALQAVLAELGRLHVAYQKKASGNCTAWWSEARPA